MNWYKQAQQGVLFYPFGAEPAEQSEKVPPISIDQETGENVYQCEMCKKPVLEGDVGVWYVREEEQPGINYQMPSYNYDRILQDITKVSQYLLPFYQQLQQYIKDQNLEKDRDDDYGYHYRSQLTRWEVQVPQLPEILRNSQQLIDICSYQFQGYNIGLCGLFNTTEIDGKTLEDLHDLIFSPEGTAKEFFEVSNQKFEIAYKVPACENCETKIDKCEFCDKLIFPRDKKWQTVWDNTSFVCEPCIENGNAEICMDCGKADSTDDMIWREDEGTICSDCYKNIGEESEKWAEEQISNLNIPVGKNLPLSEKVLNNLLNFLEGYIKKYGDNELNYKEWGRLNHLAKKSGLPNGAIEYLDSIGESYNPGNDSYSHNTIIDILDSVDNNIEAQNYMKEQYPNIKSYQDLPFDIEVLSNYSSSNKPGFTIGITPSDEFFDYAEKKYPNIKRVWDKMKYTPHHSGTLAYARCAYEMGDSLVINNLQRDADYDNFVGNSSDPKSHEAAKYIDKMTKDWDIFLLNLIKSICISKNINAYLTTFDQQKQKWGNLPIHKSKKTYEEVPERMGFPLTDSEQTSHMVEDYSDADMYQIANDVGTNWFKKAQLNDPIKEHPNYTDIAHGEGSDGDILWISDLSGNNFHRADTEDYEHHGLAYDVGLNIQTGVIKGRYDSAKNVVSISIDPTIATIRELPNRLINRLYREFGNNITIIDYSKNPSKVVI